MNRLIKTTCAIAAEEIGEEKADRVAEAKKGVYLKNLRFEVTDAVVLP